MSKIVFLLAICVSFFTFTFAQTADPTEGTLFAASKKGKALGSCPLKNTRVVTDISGFIARVRVLQEFRNDFTEPVEAVYTFPLSQNSAVDDMTMTIGDRVIKGRIMKRAAARQVYETAKEEGKTASLLDQERPNIFTQSVANIMPGEKIVIEISYVETLRYEDGQYEFVFPMVVAPRYTPVTMSSEEVAKVSPPISATRAGHDISIEVNLDAGVPVESVRSSSHGIETVNLSSNSAKITLKDEAAIPNKDFILRYDVTGKRIEDALLAHRDERGGFFTLMLLPPDKFTSEDVTPKEIVFVLDTSGSMQGRPIEKAKEAMTLSLDGLYPNDTFNIITFAGDTAILFDKPVYATQENLEKAKEFVESRQSYGGTEMMKAIRAALEPSDQPDHIRIVCFMTDGEVGNDNEIIAEIQKHPKARVFSFGIGDSVNRYLLDKMAAEGNGEMEYVGLEDDGSKAARKFYERVRTPLLTDISIEWGGLVVSDVYPQKIPDLFSAKPVVLHGRYTKPGAATVRLKGKVAGQDYSRDIAVNLPAAESEHDVLASIWARQRIDDLIGKELKYDARADAEHALKLPTINTITSLALEFRLMTQFTSFVAVEDKVVTSGGKTRTVQVPVEKPAGTAPTVDVSSIGKPSVAGGVISPGAAMTIPTATPIPGQRGKGKGRGSGTGSANGNGQGTGRSGTANRNLAPTVAASQASVDVAGVGDDIVKVDETMEVPPPPKPIAPPDPNTDRPTGSLAVPSTRNSIENFENLPIVSGGVLNGRSIEMVQPGYPATAMAVNAHRIVTVQVVIDETGQVISANAISGHLLLRQVSVQAAMRSKFIPLSLSGTPVKSTGLISYNFVSWDDVKIELLDKRAADEAKRAALTPEQQGEVDRKALLAGKLHFWVFALSERVRKAESAPALNEEKFVSGGKANIRILLTANTPEVIQKLNAAGFEGKAEKGVLTGSLPVEKLAELAAIPEVKLVLPKMR